MGDFPSHLVSVPARPRSGRARATAIGVFTVALCLLLAGGNSSPGRRSPAFLIAGIGEVPSPPEGSSWRPAPVDADGLRMVASTDGQRFVLHTAAGERGFLPGVDLGGTTPGHGPGELSISAAQYRAWFAAMAWLGIRVVRIYTIHPPAFYQQLATYNRANPNRPLFLVQGVRDRSPDLRAATRAVGDVTPWLAGWIIGAELDPYAAKASDQRNADAEAVAGKYFRSTPEATPTERRLAARMNELAGYEAAAGLSQPIAFVNRPTTDPLRHAGDVYQLDANHVVATADWPAGTFASYHVYQPTADYLTALRRHHATMPTMVTEFGVPSSIDRSEQDAMRIDGELLRLIRDRGLAGGFLFEWADEWFRSGWNTVAHQDPAGRPRWHDPLTGAQNFGLLAMDPGVSPTQALIDAEGGWPARRVTGHVDESYLHLEIRLGDSPPGSVQLGFDVLPGLTGAPMAGSVDRRPDAVFALNLVAHTGQAYLRDQLDPVPLDEAVPPARRGAAPPGWKPYELLLNRNPVALWNAGLLTFGDPTADGRSLWRTDGDEIVVRVPWAMLGFADPSAHRVGMAPRTTGTSPGIGVSLSASGTDQVVGQVSWADWTLPSYTERLKRGAAQFRDAALAVTGG